MCFYNIITGAFTHCFHPQFLCVCVCLIKPTNQSPRVGKNELGNASLLVLMLGSRLNCIDDISAVCYLLVLVWIRAPQIPQAFHLATRLSLKMGQVRFILNSTQLGSPHKMMEAQVSQLLPTNCK